MLFQDGYSPMSIKKAIEENPEKEIEYLKELKITMLAMGLGKVTKKSEIYENGVLQKQTVTSFPPQSRAVAAYFKLEEIISEREKSNHESK